MRGLPRLSSHRVEPARGGYENSSSDDEADKFVGRTCYTFNPTLPRALNDTRCSHCRFYLTARCPHIDEFLDDVDDLSPE